MTVGIVGLGLIGGSIGLALRKPGRTILGYDSSPAAAQTAIDRQCIDRSVAVEDLAAAEVIFIACPPDSVVPMLESLTVICPPDVVLTDCASVKGEIVAWAKKHKATQFVPGHPMAGHEKAGALFSSSWLFRHARWILTPLPLTDRAAIPKVEALLKDMGATPMRMNATSHDRQVAVLSHLPHVLAGLLVQAGTDLESAEIAGGSWKDLTRVGGVDPQLWTQIFLGNRLELVRVLEETEARLQAFRTALSAADEPGVRRFLEDAVEAKAKHEPKAPKAGPPSRKVTGRTGGRPRT
jgi:prephenate dehydrogenase